MWHVSDGHGTRESACTFATLKDCTADAKEHGYVPWKSEDERRREQALEVTKILARDKLQR